MWIYIFGLLSGSLARTRGELGSYSGRWWQNPPNICPPSLRGHMVPRRLRWTPPSAKTFRVPSIEHAQWLDRVWVLPLLGSRGRICDGSRLQNKVLVARAPLFPCLSSWRLGHCSAGYALAGGRSLCYLAFLCSEYVARCVGRGASSLLDLVTCSAGKGWSW